MVRLAFADLPGVVIDEREMQRSGASYTVDTLDALLAEQPGSELYLVMGGDQWAAFTSWRQWQDIARKARLCVAQRPDQVLNQPQPELAVQWLNLPAMPISATALREQVAGGTNPLNEPARLPPAVARYISDHHLYAAG
jgi:nicotinate-nucleotide adenylyltransferase